MFPNVPPEHSQRAGGMDSRKHFLCVLEAEGLSSGSGAWRGPLLGRKKVQVLTWLDLPHQGHSSHVRPYLGPGALH